MQQDSIDSATFNLKDHSIDIKSKTRYSNAKFRKSAKPRQLTPLKNTEIHRMNILVNKVVDQERKHRRNASQACSSTLPHNILLHINSSQSLDFQGSIHSSTEALPKAEKSMIKNNNAIFTSVDGISQD